MPKKMLIDATHAEETRVVVVDGNKVEEFDFETVNRRQLQGNIYLAKVTRVEPSLQAAFVDYGGNRHGFLAFAEIHPDYYQIPVADRQALIEEERALARAEDQEDDRRQRRREQRPGARPERTGLAPDTVEAPEAEAAPAEAQPEAQAPAPRAPSISGMDVVDLGEEGGADTLVDASVDQPVTETSGARERPWRSVDHASETDSEIESVAEEDMQEEISAPRKPRARRYKIQEVIKVRQIMLIQVVKEERGNKGAALTTYLSLAGRYCVLMPNTARGGGISRKITQTADRKKLKEIAQDIVVPDGAGLIIRTAGAKRTKPEIVRDYEYLMRLWEEIRELTLKSIAPAPIYEEGNLIKRTIRDLYNREIDEVLVEGEAGYRTARDFMRMIMPSQAGAVKLYTDAMPLFARFGVESYLASMFNPTVQLKSGGYIVIGVTEALVAIDVNSGRATKEGSIEDTALKTNLEAAEEVARQLRLRDLAGLIVIDFIDMEERRNNAAVEKRLKDKLKTDRARIQVGRISGFGLMEMSRQRLRPGMLESTTQPCQHCHGTGLIRSDESMALMVLRALEEEGTRKRSREVLLRAPVGIVNFLINHKREHIALIEARYAMAVRIEADPKMISPDHSIEKFKTATRLLNEPAHPVISGDASLMGAAVEEIEEEDIVEDAVAEDEGEEAPVEVAAARGEAARGDAGRGENGNGKKKRRRRRRRGGARTENGVAVAADGADEGADEGDDGLDADEGDDADEAVAQAAEPVVAEAAPAKPRRTRTRKPRGVAEDVPEAVEAAPAETGGAPAKRTRTRRGGAKDAPAEAAAETAPAPARPARSRKPKAAPEVEAPAEPVVETVPLVEMIVPVPETAIPVVQPVEAVAAFPADPGERAVTLAQAPVPDPQAAAALPAAEPDGKPKKKGWWSLGR